MAERQHDRLRQTAALVRRIREHIEQSQHQLKRSERQLASSREWLKRCQGRGYKP